MSCISFENNVFYKLLTISTKIELSKLPVNNKSILDDNLNPQRCEAHSYLPHLSAQRVARHVLSAFPSNDTIQNKMILDQLRKRFNNFNQIIGGILDFIRINRGFVNIIGINSKPDQITKNAIKLLKIALSEPSKLEELKYLLSSNKKAVDTARFHIKLLGGQKYFVLHAHQLFKQLLVDKKAHNLAGNAGLYQVKAKSSSLWAYEPLEIMPSCSSFYSSDLLQLNKKLQSITTEWHSSCSYEDQDKLIRALTDYTESIKIPQADIALAKQMVKAHFLHVTSAKLRVSDHVTEYMAKLISFYPHVNAIIRDSTVVDCQFLRSQSLKIMLTVTILMALFPKAAIETMNKESIENVSASANHIWKYIGGFDQKIFDTLKSSFKTPNYKKNFLNYANKFRDSFVQKFSYSNVLKHLEMLTSNEFAKISEQAFSILPSDTQSHLYKTMPLQKCLMELSDAYDLYEKTEDVDYTPQFKSPIPQNNPKNNPIECLSKSSSFDDSEESLVEQFSAVSINDCHEIQQEPVVKFNDFCLHHSPRVTRWFYPSAISIFKNDINYADLSKNRYFEMIVRHAFSKAVDRYVQTHFIQIQSKTALGPCTLFIAKGLIQIDDQEFDGYFEYVVTPEGELIHRYFSDPKDILSHRRADELLDDFVYNSLPKELQGEWNIVGLKAKEEETNDYVVISEEFTVDKIKKNVSIYIHKKQA